MDIGGRLGVAGIAVTARPGRFEAELVFRMAPGLASVLAESESKLGVSNACVRFMKRHQTRESIEPVFRELAPGAHRRRPLAIRSGQTAER
ncbi:hypothetical protein AKJ43_01875 [candidate division MSBL1 archaeon SCGC-AAA261D19]|uniref:Uncharacterized protein n=1 Tax=candidate division MSBL1 archaeon SCGC-AAA261D19 TaxID=1698273 RepID=A0A133V7H2_9EURY|nr:hypothetical protein AKJ43_01875 [candidate division MSBL1 archaeon SCGC-AAA261D19]